ncbi:MAG TPA: hypothetical protein DCM14_00850 [Clostridiales bacterium UBA8153]|nr:hypothetical protein [Clostridiales bacterium UBA8153]
MLPGRRLRALRVLSRAVVDLRLRLKFRPDAIHCNDWQTGPVPFLLKPPSRPAILPTHLHGSHHP